MSERVIVEIRAAEGGADAKDLVYEQFGVYARYASLHGLTVALLDERPGLLTFEAAGAEAERLFSTEPGGHRWQRVPPTERSGRRHTSTVTVAVLPIDAGADVAFDEADIEWQATRGSGAGGQARNKTSNAVQMRHLPSGLTVRVETERSQTQNRQTALRILAARLAAQEREARTSAVAGSRKAQVGSGQRGDKIRTVRMQDGRVVDHRTGKRARLDRYLAGHVEEVA